MSRAFFVIFGCAVLSAAVALPTWQSPEVQSGEREGEGERERDRDGGILALLLFSSLLISVLDCVGAKAVRGYEKERGRDRHRDRERRKRELKGNERKKTQLTSTWQ
jgi:hypothetical protein